MPLVLSIVLLFAGPAQAAQTQAGTAIECEFRAFDEAREVTAETRFRVFPRGVREGGTTLEQGDRQFVRLEAGIYDVQAIRHSDGTVLSIRWLEHFMVMPYPDELGRHLQVVNFHPDYGALQLRQQNATTAPEASVYVTGDRDNPVGKSFPGEDYTLLVLPAGDYDIHVRQRTGSRQAQWLVDVEVPAGRTRLKIVSW
jgi:hypothetical protein